MQWRTLLEVVWSVTNRDSHLTVHWWVICHLRGFRYFHHLTQQQVLTCLAHFFLKYGRNKKIKAALVTCATTRAVHLEIVKSLSTNSFLHALQRFMSHHGWPSTIISDNGTSFIGAEKELRRFIDNGQKGIQEFSALHNVRWIFTTPLSPHQGGIYESLIKQVKHAICVAIGQQTLTWNEMSTVFSEIECLLNSRQLGYCTSDPNDLQPLTPNHFIPGHVSPEIPQGQYDHAVSMRKRLDFTQSLVTQFWKRFIREYIPTLMQHTKWKTQGRWMTVGYDCGLSIPTWDMAFGTCCQSISG